MNTMGIKIRRARVRLALTLDELALKTGISKAYLSLIETGRLANPPSDDKLRTLAEAVGLPANELLGRAHVQRIPPDVRALLDELMRLQGQPFGGPGAAGGPGTLGGPGAPAGGIGLAGGMGSSATSPKSSGGTSSTSSDAGKTTNADRRPSRRGASGDRPTTAGAHGLPLNLDAAYRSGVLQELADRNGGGGNIEPIPMGPAVSNGPAATGSTMSGTTASAFVALPGDVSAKGDASILGAVAAGVSAAGRRLVPVVNKVSAGYPSDFTDLSYPPRVADAYIAAPGVDDPDAFAARVSGDSMMPKYAEGDIVVFSPAAAWKDGADCFVRFEDGQTTFKRVYADWTPDDREALRLQPRNDRYPPRVVPREQITGVYRAVSVYRALGD